MGVISYAATGGGKHKAKSTTTKENKKFTTVGFRFTGTNITDPDSWTSADPVTFCTGTVTLCGITFDDGTYPLDLNGKPTTDFLTNQVNVHKNDSPGSHSFTVNGVTYYRKAS